MSSLFAQFIRSKPYLFMMGWSIRAIAELYFLTLRLRFCGPSTLPEKALLALWHNRLLLSPLLSRRFKHTRFVAVISKSRDGLLLGAFIKTYRNIDIIHVSHLNRHMALLQIVDAIKSNKVLLITPDGPRGPKYRVKPGLAYSAKKADAPICAMDWHSSSMYTFGSWDNLRLPKPFSKVEIRISEPLPVNEDWESHLSQNN